MTTITPQILLRAYAAGIVPMAESAEDNALYWVEPEERGIIPLDGLRISRSLRKCVRQRLFEVRVDTDFAGVIAGCAAKTAERKSPTNAERCRTSKRKFRSTSRPPNAKRGPAPAPTTAVRSRWRCKLFAAARTKIN